MAYSLALITEFLFLRKISLFPLILILTQNDRVLETLRNMPFSSVVSTKFMANTSCMTVSHTVPFSLVSSNVSAFYFHFSLKINVVFSSMGQLAKWNYY